ncbi:MAG: hypothetical protein U0905_13090 [Pirellulales bacterium]
MRGQDVERFRFRRLRREARQIIEFLAAGSRSVSFQQLQLQREWAPNVCSHISAISPLKTGSSGKVFGPDVRLGSTKTCKSGFCVGLLPIASNAGTQGWHSRSSY